MDILKASKTATLGLSLIATLALGTEADTKEVKQMEEAVKSNPLKEAYFGEIHTHTALSLDALFGMTATVLRTPGDAYEFAKGKEIILSGEKHSIGRPLDFAAVTDHAEYIGESYSAITPGAPGYDSKDLQELRNAKTFDEQMKWYGKFSINQRGKDGPTHPEYYAGPKTTQSAWKMIIGAAKDHYTPGKFTTIVGYEYSSVVKGGNLHRNILFRDMNLPDQPFSAIESTDETKLWEWMEQQEKNGSTLLAIPHNSNAGKGLMFPTTYPDGRAFDERYLYLRNHFERSVELMQAKGNSEVTKGLWLNDEMADFENAPTIQEYSGRTQKKENYVRWAVIEGLKYQKKNGVNPFKLGFNGGTDTHNGVMGDVAEDDFVGAHGSADSNVKLRREGELPSWMKAKDQNPGSLTGVWATKNTRGEIWDAFYNREIFVTSGPRIRVRLFAGENLAKNPNDAKKMVEDGYKNGVPMGGTITGLKKVPTFTVWALKDVEGANLDRIQIIKGWVDKAGEHQEKIINVVWSDKRKLDKNGKLPKVGNTVDLKTAKYSNDIGSSVLMGSFTDSAFDATLPTIYYARVIEIPTPRWSTYDAVRNKLPLLKDVPSTIQERAWTSPIWFTPTTEKRI